MARVTDKNVRRAVAHYARTLAGYGWGRGSLIDYQAPYGQVTYLVTDDGGRISHDVPGFTGTGGAGFVTAREAYARIHAAAAAVADYARDMGRMFDYDAGGAAWAAVMERVGLGEELREEERPARASWEWQLWADYGSGMEYVCTAEDRNDARRVLADYRRNDAAGRGHEVRKVRAGVRS